MSRAKNLLAGSFLLYAVLVATNLGEFWPFSIYPMFSQGGNPWSRALVRDVTGEPFDSTWQTVSWADLPGSPFATMPNGLDHTDLANFVSKTERWNEERVGGLRTMFRAHTGERDLLVMRANGRMIEGDSVLVEFVPYVLLSGGRALANPELPR
jgi:hypothetical protein